MQSLFIYLYTLSLVKKGIGSLILGQMFKTWCPNICNISVWVSYQRKWGPTILLALNSIPYTSLNRCNDTLWVNVAIPLFWEFNCWTEHVWSLFHHYVPHEGTSYIIQPCLKICVIQLVNQDCLMWMQLARVLCVFSYQLWWNMLLRNFLHVCKLSCFEQAHHDGGKYI
jgi:hypothetical protein